MTASRLNALAHWVIALDKLNGKDGSQRLVRILSLWNISVSLARWNKHQRCWFICLFHFEVMFILPELKHLFCRSSCIYKLQHRLFWRPNTVNMKLNEAPLFLCFALAFCFDHTNSWHIYHQLFNSARSGPTLIGATRNKSKQEVGVVPNRAHNAPKTANVFSFCPLSLHVSCYFFTAACELIYGFFCSRPSYPARYLCCSPGPYSNLI